MNKNVFRSLGGAALIASVLLGSTACGSSPSAAPAPSPSATVAPEKATNTAVGDAISGFFATATSKEIGAAFPNKATDTTFAPVLAKVDTAAPGVPLKKAVTDLALLKVSDPKAALAVKVDESKVAIDGVTASVPASAISVTSGGKKVANSDVLAAEINHLVYRDGSWLVTFPVAPSASPSASASASSTPSPSASK
jgi:hypothetical protein